MAIVNLALKRYAKDKGVRWWQVAEEIGISESALCRVLRHELDLSQTKYYRNYIDRVYKAICDAKAAERKEADNK